MSWQQLRVGWLAGWLTVAEPGLASETVQGATLTLQRVHDVHRCNGLALGVFGVGDRITDHILQEYFQHATSFLVDQARDTLHSSTAGQTTDGRLGDALDVIAQHFPMTLGSSFTQTFASLSASSHVDLLCSGSRFTMLSCSSNFRPFIHFKPHTHAYPTSYTLCEVVCV